MSHDSRNPRSGLVFAFSNPTSAEFEDEFNAWYNEFHVRDALLYPGYERARRYVRSPVQFEFPNLTALPQRYLALYHLSDVGLMPEANKLAPWVAQVSASFTTPAADSSSLDGTVFETVLDTGPPSAARPDQRARPAIAIVITTSTGTPSNDERDAQMERLCHNLALPGVLRGRRLDFAPLAEQRFPDRTSHGPATSFTMYDIDDASSLPAFVAAMPTVGEVTSRFVGPPEAPRFRAILFEQIFETTEPSVLPEGVEYPS